MCVPGSCMTGLDDMAMNRGHPVAWVPSPGHERFTDVGGRERERYRIPCGIHGRPNQAIWV